MLTTRIPVCLSLVLAVACSSGETSARAAADSVAAAAALTPPPPPTPRLDVGETMQFVGGGRLWVRVRGLGAGTPLVLVHGAPGAGSYALKPLEALAEDRNTARYDHLGVGKSDPLPDAAAVSINHAVEDLEGLRRALKIEIWHVLGHSYGAAIASAYAQARPDRVASLVLVNPLLSGAADSAHASTSIAALTDTVQRGYAADLDSLGTTNGQRVSDALRRAAVDPANKALTVDSVATSLRATKIQALVLSGADDVAGTKIARRLAAAMPGTKLVVYPKAGPFTAWDQKDALIKDIRTFLKKMDDRVK
jgi:pimeloyl-ACP methyl ester carboxylesterase